MHGGLDVACMTTFGNVTEGDILMVEQLVVASLRMLPMRLGGIEEIAKVIAIGCGKGP
ncbi:hypothetical protein H0Z09_14945 [Pseudomonas sp. SWRI18]|uniref:hypothetical protein n=1 Tax=Pseudomonas sp. SWRI18 TaxID=2753888 RepID=UPI001645CF28|nr:hypothetical protein [Pseudomonas sp. SWRI18]MBC3302424.1 hypothetical protein [Pseudomonas sp. SWRI18]